MTYIPFKEEIRQRRTYRQILQEKMIKPKLIYNKNQTQVYISQLRDYLLVEIDEHCMNNDVSSKIVFSGSLKYDYCERFLKNEFDIDLDSFIDFIDY